MWSVVWFELGWHAGEWSVLGVEPPLGEIVDIVTVYLKLLKIAIDTIKSNWD